MELGYRAVLRFDATGDNAIAVAESQMHAWLRSKQSSGLEAADWDGPGIHDVGRDSTLTVVHADDARDTSRRRLYRLRERNAAGIWEVSVYAFDTPQSRSHQQSLVIDVATSAAADPREAVAKVSPPRLVRMILDSYAAHDGSAKLSGRPFIVRGEEAYEVLEAITDPVRTAAVVLAPWGGENASEWHNVVSSLTRDSVGVASIYILDASATAITASHLPDSHGVGEGVVRTYGPRVNLDAPEDRLRHRMLFPDTLARSLSSSKKVAEPLAKRHAESTRLRVVTRELQPDLRRGIDVLRRTESAQERSRAIRSTVSTSVEGRRLAHDPDTRSTGLGASLAELVKRWLTPGRDVDSNAVIDLGTKLEEQALEIKLLNEQSNSLAEQNLQVREELDSTRGQFDDLHLAVTIAEDAARDNERELAVLRTRLISSGQSERTFVEPLVDHWKAPDDMYELLARITPGVKNHPAFGRVVFTGDQGATLEIEKRGQGMRYAHAFWNYIHVLYDYAEGKSRGEITCGVHQYLQSDHLNGHKCPPDRHAPTESSTTLARWGRERTFPVPEDVKSSKSALMAAHFKPTWSDTFAPRMHYFDDTDFSGKVYVGYIGRHLPNTKT